MTEERSGITWDGVPIEELTREELIAALVISAKGWRQSSETFQKIADIKAYRVK